MNCCRVCSLLLFFNGLCVCVCVSQFSHADSDYHCHYRQRIKHLSHQLCPSQNLHHREHHSFDMYFETKSTLTYY